MTIKKAQIEDLKNIAILASKLFHDDCGVLEKEFDDLLKNADAFLIVAYENKIPVGFVQIQIRKDYVEGCKTNFVGYLEGVFVEESFRRQGLAKKMLAIGVSWAKEKGCTEFASDCELDNDASIAFHTALGFEIANKIVCFKKEI